MNIPEKQKKATVGFFDPVSEKTGGAAYREALCKALAGKYDVERFKVTGESGIVPSVRLRRMVQIAKVKKTKDVWIRDFYPVVGMSFRRNPGKNIGLFHHMQTEGEESDALGRLFGRLFLYSIRKCDRVVTVGEYWKNYLQGHGARSVRVIQNAMEPERFKFELEEIEEFRNRYSLTNSNVIYIGNCRRQKGVVEVHEVLKDRGYTLVTSGEPDVDLPCLNLNLSYREYLLLLKISSVVVTMSKFREGWCRNAHEAMLCKTPVVGSGAGGMAELLEGGKQLMCQDIYELPRLVEKAEKERKRMGEEGYQFASRFTLERFEREWLDLVDEVIREDFRSDRTG
jgi:glycosyltransferase involved in cell wall biosynthesis